MATTGQWSVAGINIPDFGLTEKVFAPGTTAPGGTQLYNPAIPQSQGQSSYNFPSGFAGGSVGGSTVGGGGGGSLVKDASGNLVPSTPSNTSNIPTYVPGTANNNAPARISGINPTAADVNPADRDAWAIQRGFTGWNNYLDSLRSQGPSEADINAQIDATYNPTMDYLNQNVNYVGQAKTAAEKQAEADLLANQAQLGTQKEGTLGQLATQGRGVQTQKEDALATARRLYGELQRGNIQRFGGTTSAGQAASEIQGAEAQRQFGGIGRQANEAFQKIEQAKTDVESQYQSGLLQLKQGQQQALAKIQNDFTNAIMQINNMRAQTEQQKGQAKLQALQNLRQEALQLQSQATQYEQQLNLMREQQKLQLDSYAKTTGLAGTAGANAYNTFSNQSMTPTQFSQVQSGVQNIPQQLQGSIKRPEEWQYQGQIGKAVVGRLPDGRALYSDGTAGWSY